MNDVKHEVDRSPKRHRKTVALGAGLGVTLNELGSAMADALEDILRQEQRPRHRAA